VQGEGGREWWEGRRDGREGGLVVLIEDRGELLVLAPMVKKFGEDEAIDALIR